MENNNRIPELTPEKAADLVKEGQVPVIQTVITGIGENQRKEMIFFIPPAGTQIGDNVSGRPAVGYAFTGQDGKYRGRAETVSMSFALGKKVRASIEQTLRESKIDKTSRIRCAARRAIRWFSELPM